QPLPPPLPPRGPHWTVPLHGDVLPHRRSRPRLDLAGLAGGRPARAPAYPRARSAGFATGACVVLLDDLLGNPAPLGHLLAVLAGPFPNGSVLLAVASG